MIVSDVALAPQQRAGYRVLRSLSRDEHAEVLLGFLPGEEGRESTAVALKAFPATAEVWRRVIAELEALERARGPHVVELRDVDADDAGITLIFERLPRGSLAELLRVREQLDGGEAVTLLAPIATTIARMHSAGVAHGALGVRTVLFRADGAPTLIGFGRADCFAPSAPEVVLERVEAVVADRAAVRVLIAAVLGRVRGPRARAARELLAAIEGCPDEALLPLVTSRIFELAAAVPVRFSVDEQPKPDARSDRVVPLGDPVREAPGSASWSAALGRVLARLVPESWARRAVDAVEASLLATVIRPAADAALRRWHGWSGRRRRAILAVAAGAMTIAVVAAVLPSSDAVVARPASETSHSPGTTKGSAFPGGETEAVIHGDDPIAATLALVRARERCLTSLSLGCLDGVDQADSGAIRDDRAAIRAVQRGGEPADPLVRDLARLAPVLIERLGDSALVRLTEAARAEQTAAPTPGTEPASILLVKAEAGWRIRDVIAAARATGPQPATGPD